jgi:hypothetical protein
MNVHQTLVLHLKVVIHEFLLDVPEAPLKDPLHIMALWIQFALQHQWNLIKRYLKGMVKTL